MNVSSKSSSGGSEQAIIILLSIVGCLAFLCGSWIGFHYWKKVNQNASVGDSQAARRITYDDVRNRIMNMHPAALGPDFELSTQRNTNNNSPRETVIINGK